MIKNSSKPSDGHSESPSMPSSRPMTLRQQLDALIAKYDDWHECEEWHIHDGSDEHEGVTPKPHDFDTDKFRTALETLCQEIAREARSDWTLELPDLPWFQIKAFNEERAEWWSPIYDTTNLPVELTQKPPQPPQGGLEEASDGSS